MFNIKSSFNIALSSFLRYNKKNSVKDKLGFI